MNCLHTETEVVQTEKMDDGLPLRRRRCKRCGILIHTEEVVIRVTKGGVIQKIPSQYIG